MYSQVVGRYSQGVALGYDLVGLSARFLFVRDDDLVGLSVRCPIDWGDDSGDVPILFVVPMDGDALHLNRWVIMRAESPISL